MTSRTADAAPCAPAPTLHCPFCQGSAVVSASRTASPYRRCDACGAVWHPEHLRPVSERISARRTPYPERRPVPEEDPHVMTLAVRRTLHGAVVSLTGRLTGVTGGQLRDSLAVTRSQAQPQIVVNFAQVTAVDRGGANALLDAYTATTLRSGSLSVTRLPASVRDALGQYGLLTTIRVFASDGLAISAMSAPEGDPSISGGQR